MLTLSAAAIIEKNKMTSDGAWLVMLKITLPDTTVLRLVRNTENVTWNGQTWQAFPFELDDVTEDSKGEIPVVTIKVSNVTRTIQYYLEQGNGGIGSEVILYVVHSKHLDLVAAEIEETFQVNETSCDSSWVTFRLGAAYPLMSRRPEKRVFKNFCPFEYGGVECGVADATKVTYPTCNRTLGECRTRTNSLRFGGEFSIPSGGLYV